MKPVLVATCIKQAPVLNKHVFSSQTGKQMYLYQASTCLKQADFECLLGTCLIQVGLYLNVTFARDLIGKVRCSSYTKEPFYTDRK